MKKLLLSLLAFTFVNYASAEDLTKNGITYTVMSSVDGVEQKTLIDRQVSVTVDYKKNISTFKTINNNDIEKNNTRYCYVSSINTTTPNFEIFVSESHSQRSIYGSNNGNYDFKSNVYQSYKTLLMTEDPKICSYSAITTSKFKYDGESVDKNDRFSNSLFYKNYDQVFEKDVFYLIYSILIDELDNNSYHISTSYIPTKINSGIFVNATEVTIGSTIEVYGTGIQAGCFANATKLNTFKSSSVNYEVDTNGFLYSKDKAVLIAIPANTKAGVYELPNNCSEIAANALANCANAITLKSSNSSLSYTTLGGNAANKVMKAEATLNGSANGTHYNVNEGQVITATNLASLTSALSSSNYTYIDFRGSSVSGELDLTAIGTNPNTIYLFDADATVSGTNVVVGSNCETLVLKDGNYSFESPISFNVNNVTYTRTFTASQWGTLVLPFTLNSTNSSEYKNFKAAALESYDGEKINVKYTAGAEISANVPYTLYTVTGCSAIHAENVKVMATTGSNSTSDNGVQFIATYSRINSMEGKYGVTGAGTIAKGTSANGLNPFRAYFTIPSSSSVKALNFIEEDDQVALESDPTKINSVEADAKTNVYSTNGSLVKKNVNANNATEGLNPGIYVVNGKKILVK